VFGNAGTEAEQGQPARVGGKHKMTKTRRKEEREKKKKENPGESQEGRKRRDERRT
jgi:hypothetical protein